MSRAAVQLALIDNPTSAPLTGKITATPMARAGKIWVTLRIDAENHASMSRNACWPSTRNAAASTKAAAALQETTLLAPRPPAVNRWPP